MEPPHARRHPLRSRPGARPAGLAPGLQRAPRLHRPHLRPRAGVLYQRARREAELARVLYSTTRSLQFPRRGEAALEERGYLFHNDFIIFDEAHTLKAWRAGISGWRFPRQPALLAPPAVPSPHAEGIVAALRSGEAMKLVLEAEEESDSSSTGSSARSTSSAPGKSGCASRALPRLARPPAGPALPQPGRRRPRDRGRGLQGRDQKRPGGSDPARRVGEFIGRPAPITLLGRAEREAGDAPDLTARRSRWRRKLRSLIFRPTPPS